VTRYATTSSSRPWESAPKRALGAGHVVDEDGAAQRGTSQRLQHVGADERGMRAENLGTSSENQGTSSENLDTRAACRCKHVGVPRHSRRRPRRSCRVHRHSCRVPMQETSNTSALSPTTSSLLPNTSALMPRADARDLQYRRTLAEDVVALAAYLGTSAECTPDRYWVTRRSCPAPRSSCPVPPDVRPVHPNVTAALFSRTLSSSAPGTRAPASA
jgi:hypothetical protein